MSVSKKTYKEQLHKRREFYYKHLLTNSKLYNSCPVCGFPTLLLRLPHEICSICLWQDDGQDDYNANSLGGPNGKTLTEYRDAFHNRVLILKSKTWLYDNQYWLEAKKQGYYPNKEAFTKATNELLDKYSKLEQEELAFMQGKRPQDHYIRTLSSIKHDTSIFTFLHIH